MSDSVFKVCLLLAASLFTIIFFFLVVPPLLQNPDVIGAFAAGFVNPYAAGYSTDVFFCWFILAIWVWYEASNLDLKHGWFCLVIGIVPGVAVGFALYLFMRHSQLSARSKKDA